jgi:hypothetical protein
LLPQTPNECQRLIHGLPRGVRDLALGPIARGEPQEPQSHAGREQRNAEVLERRAANEALGERDWLRIHQPKVRQRSASSGIVFTRGGAKTPLALLVAGGEEVEVVRPIKRDILSTFREDHAGLLEIPHSPARRTESQAEGLHRV